MRRKARPTRRHSDVDAVYPRGDGGPSQGGTVITLAAFPASQTVIWSHQETQQSKRSRGSRNAKTLVVTRVMTPTVSLCRRLSPATKSGGGGN